jgi:phage FluMu gp28-like protein
LGLAAARMTRLREDAMPDAAETALDALIPKHEGRELPGELEGMAKGDLLLGYQSRAHSLLGSTSLLVIEKSRRIGLTWALAAEAVLTASAQKGAGGKDALYISYSQDMTREFIDACAMWSKAFMNITADVGEALFEDQDEHGNTRSIKAFRINFASGFEIMALSSAPRSLRGKQGLLIVDEAAFVDSLAALLKAAMAFLIWGGKVAVVSTHNGVDNPFNELLDEIRAGKRKGATLRISFADAMADGLYERISLVKGETPTPEGRIAFEADVRGYYGDDAAEELDCIPSTGAGAFIPPDLVAAAQRADCNKPDLYKGGPCVGGRDVSAGRGGHLAPQWVFELLGVVMMLRERREERDLKLTEQEAVTDGLFRRYHMLRFGIDQTGIGEGEVERAVKKHGSRVEGVIFSPAMQLMMANAMLKRFQDGTIWLDDDPAIRADFRSVKRAKGTGHQIRLVTEMSTDGGDNKSPVHGDRFWACALACLMADLDAPTCHGYRPAEKARGRFDEGTEDFSDGEMRMRIEDRMRAAQRFGRGAW